MDRLLHEASSLIDAFGRTATAAALGDSLDNMRAQIRKGTVAEIDRAAILRDAGNRLADQEKPSPGPVFNLSGTILHTNLGRAPLAKEAVDAMVAAAGSCDLEFDLQSGKRGDRDRHVSEILCRLTGAEAATVVNNNAAAVLLVLNTLARRKEVPVSRGELIEIGGSFRLPDVMARAGCKLVEVGTTNRTHVQDYENVVGPRTALLLKAHTSNYVVNGFTAHVSEAELATIARNHGIPAVIDLGSGSLVNMACYGLRDERTVRQSIEDGMDVVTFSGDKLLGGPQAGLIVGNRTLIEKIKRNPLRRALRCDKITLAALNATLKLYEHPEKLAQRLPGIRLMERPLDEIEALGHRLAQMLSAYLPEWLVSLESATCQIGSGAAPTRTLASKALVFRGRGRTSQRHLKALSALFRSLPIPVIGRLHDGAFWIDLRCLEDEDGFVAQLNDASSNGATVL